MTIILGIHRAMICIRTHTLPAEALSIQARSQRVLRALLSIELAMYAVYSNALSL